MYSEEYNEEQKEVAENNYNGFSNFYHNNKILIWVAIAIILIIIAVFMFKGKGNNSSGPDKDYTISIAPETDIVIPLGGSSKLIAIVSNDANANIIWASSDENIAKVDNGNVTAINYGKVVIIATYYYGDNKKVEARKDVTISDGNPNTPLTDVSIKTGDLIMPTNGKYSISLELTPTNGYLFSKSFSSLNENVATVTNSGYVEAHGEGETEITIDINNGAIVRKLKVLVNNDYTSPQIVVNPTKIALSKEITKLKVGESAKISYTITPEEASLSILNWTSSDETVLRVDKNGIIEALKEGKVTIKVTSANGISDSLDIEVEPSVIDITDIQLSISDFYLEIGNSEIITPVIIPTDAINPQLTYTSNNPTVVSVLRGADNISCMITAIGEGNATITVKAEGSNISKTINVMVSVPSSTPSDGGGGSSCNKKCSQGEYLSSCKCVKCPAGNYCQGNKKTACPSNYRSSEGAKSINDCYMRVANGYYATWNGSSHTIKKCTGQTTTQGYTNAYYGRSTTCTKTSGGGSGSKTDLLN